MTMRSYIELVRKHIPCATDDYCEYVLWEKTAFPLASAETINGQIIEYAAELSEQSTLDLTGNKEPDTV